MSPRIKVPNKENIFWHDQSDTQTHRKHKGDIDVASHQRKTYDYDISVLLFMIILERKCSLMAIIRHKTKRSDIFEK